MRCKRYLLLVIEQTTRNDIVSIQRRLDAWARERELRTISWMSVDEIQLIIDALYRDLRLAQNRDVQKEPDG